MSAAPPNLPNAAKKWSWPLTPLLGTKLRIDQALITTVRKSLSLCASASLRAAGPQDATAYLTRSTHTPDAAPASISVSA